MLAERAKFSFSFSRSLTLLVPLLALILALVLASTSPTLTPQSKDEWSGVERIVAIGSHLDVVALGRQHAVESRGKSGIVLDHQDP